LRSQVGSTRSRSPRYDTAMRNVEAKFKLRDLNVALELAQGLGFTPRAEFSQRDTFFRTTAGKLKLREEGTAAALIYYHRSPSGDVQLSDYEIVPIAEPERIRAILAAAFGIIAEVRKRRTLLMRDNVRLHLDRVEALGDFGEIEAVLTPGESEQANRGQVARILEQLRVAPADLIEVSYFELLAGR
jgi:predicted adenylyl cyclase CyaB